ncbi:MAG: peptide MFS transporter [Crocinitomicaceae bacterium]|nr:peptide MFS transporter [Crocinitomicaceae bacterium]
MSNSSSSTPTKTFMGHPVGLFVLFFTEMWERFSYYGMRAILVLYLTHITTGDNAGLGWTESNALELYGWYTMLVYVMSIPGGIIADRLLGQKRSVMIGGILLCLGHGVLAIEQMWAFYSGLILIILGVGMLKPNISTMVGGLYKKGDIRRDKGFTIFYIGINLGAFLSSLIVGYVGETIGWHYGFGLAGIGMVLGQIIYMLGQKHLVGIGDLMKDKDPETEQSVQMTDSDLIDDGVKASSPTGAGGKSEFNLFVQIFTTPWTLVCAVLAVPAAIVIGLFINSSLGFFSGVLLFLFAFFGAMFKDLNKIERDRISVVLLSFAIVVVFWGAFEQAGGLMNLYTKNKTDRMLMGMEIPASVFQSLNAAFIILLGSLVAAFWAKRKIKNKESSSLFKMAIGTVIMGSGFLFMTGAAAEYESSGSSAMYWLVLAYLFHTIGELCTSPVSLSFITKLTPLRYGSIMMGTYFAMTGFGNKLAATIGESASQLGEYVIFTGIAVFCAVFGILIISLLKILKRLTHGAEDNEGTIHEEAEGFEIADVE